MAVLGPNGAGKSTLLSAVAGLTPVSGGQILLDGEVLDDASTGAFLDAADRPVGFVFQSYRLFPHLSVRDNVAFSPRARGMSRSDARAAADDWLARLGLTELSGRRPGELSGGQAQRVALGRALAGDPTLLLLDEPLSALDARTRLDVQTELKRHLSSFAGPCLVVTHDPLEALVLADRLVVLEHGRIVQEGSPGRGRPPPGHRVRRQARRPEPLHRHRGRRPGHPRRRRRVRRARPRRAGPVLVALRPSAVIVSPHRPDVSSARNTWPATIVGLTMLTDRVRLDLVGEPSALVDVTPGGGRGARHRPGRPRVAVRQGHRARGVRPDGRAGSRRRSFDGLTRGPCSAPVWEPGRTRDSTRRPQMCRWIAYTGSPVLLDELLYKPANSLVMQSLHSRLGAEPTNGDGFGVGLVRRALADARAVPQRRAGVERPEPA